MRKLILGTAGHIDHGKTALVRALTGVDTDRLPEEKRRGITIDLGFANLSLPAGDEIGIVDVPGHEGFVRNMLAGATGVDIALLVIAADESVMPQTREHLAILDLLGVRGGLVALTKTDLVDAAWLELVTDEVRETVAGGALDDAPIVAVSARTGQGIDHLLAAIEQAVAGVDDRAAEDLFRLPIDRVFTVHGTGTVVTGTVWSGTLRRDQTLRLLPADRLVRVRGLQAFGQERDTIQAGERAAIALTGVARADVERGDTLAGGEGWQPSSMLTAHVRVLPDSPRPLRARQRVRFHLGTAEVLGRIALLDGGELQPGEEGWVQLRLEAPVVARAGDRFVLRSYSPVTTMAGGRIAEPTPPKRKRLLGEDRDRLDTVLGGTVVEAVACTVQAFGSQGVATARLPVLTPHAPAALVAALAGDAPVLDLDGLLVHPIIVQACRQRLLSAVVEHHRDEPLGAGPTLDELRRSLPRGTAPALFEHALRELAHAGVVVVDGSVVRSADFTPSLTADQESAVRRILQTFTAADLAPPALAELPADLAGRSDLDRLIRYLERTGALIQVAHGLWIETGILDQAIRRVRSTFQQGSLLSPADFRTLYGVSRKYLIPLLEYFDRAGVTVRRGDQREVARASDAA